MCDKFFGPFFRRDHLFVCEAYDDTNPDCHLWSSIIKFKDTNHQEIMNEICFATVFVKISAIKIAAFSKLSYTPVLHIHCPTHVERHY